MSKHCLVCGNSKQDEDLFFSCKLNKNQKDRPLCLSQICDDFFPKLATQQIEKSVIKTENPSCLKCRHCAPKKEGHVYDSDFRCTSKSLLKRKKTNIELFFSAEKADQAEQCEDYFTR